MRKSFLVLAVCVAMISSLTACGNKSDKKTKKDNKATETDAQPVDSEDTTATTEEVTTEDGSYPEITTADSVEYFDSVVKIGNAAFEMYTYVDSAAKSYTSLVNDVADQLSGTATVYDMIVPISTFVTCPDALMDQMKTSDAKESYDSLYSMISDKVKCPNVYDNMMKHRNEYVCFRTDHHWTALGAYYAYQVFCEEAGLTAHSLSDYKISNYGDYLGSFYTDTGKNADLTPDQLMVYFPVDFDSASMTYKTSDGSSVSSNVILNASQTSTLWKYGVFIAGDNPYTEIKNNNIADGSSCIVIKESFGNAFAPFLLDHFQTVYVLDYRYWTGSIIDFAKENNVGTVIFLNSISMTRNSYLIGKMAGIE